MMKMDPRAPPSVGKRRTAPWGVCFYNCYRHCKSLSGQKSVLTNKLHRYILKINMQHIIQFRIYKGEKSYVGEGLDFPIVTQGRTIDEVVKNLKEALELHLEGENLADLGFTARPSVLVNLELDSVYAET